MRLTIVHLYPSVLSQYGDRGNLVALLQRCRWRGIDADVVGLELGQPVDPDQTDIVLIGGGADSHQRLISDDLIEVKGDGLRAAVEKGAAGLAICAGYQLFGHYYRTADGTELPGLGIFDAHTVHRASEVGAKLDSITRAGSVRAVGNLVVQWGDQVLVGFENHGGRTYLHPGATPLGRVLVGRGNNSRDGWEGCVTRNFIGSYLHGPALPKNPHLVDHLIAGALQRRYGEAQLPKLDDGAEWVAHDRALERAMRDRPSRWRRLSGALSRQGAGAPVQAPGRAAHAGPEPAPEPARPVAPGR